jgi:hypothetical protein
MMQIGDFCYRLNGVAVLEMPWRIRLSDGSTRTDPSQYTLIDGLLESLGYVESVLTQEDIDAIQLGNPEGRNWAAFRLALAGSSAYRRIVGHSNETLSLLPLLTNLAFMIDTDPPKAIEFAYVWNQVSAIAEPTSEEIATLNGIALANNVPLVLNELGLMG